MQQMLAVMVGIGLAVLGRQPVVLCQQVAEARADGVRIADQLLRVGGEGREGGGRHALIDACPRAPLPVGLLTQADRCDLVNVVTIDDIRPLALSLPRTTEALVRDRVKFRVGRIVYLAFSRDETQMGFAFPKQWREVLVGSDPDKFLMPTAGDLRYNWVEVRLAALEPEEMREFVVDAWRMVVPKRVAEAYDAA